MKPKSILILIYLFFLVLSSCKKYDEGPGLSLRSRNARISNTWLIEKFKRNEIDSTSTYWSEGSEITFYENGNADLTQLFHVKNNNIDTTIEIFHTGSWELVQNNNYLYFILTNDFDNTTDTSAFEIKKLKEKELQFKEPDYEGNKYSDEYFLVSKIQ